MPPTETRVGDSRRDPRALLVLIAVLLLLRIGVTAWEQRHPPTPHDLVHWVAFERAEAMSRRTGKPILYDFTAAWCGPCQAMERDVFCSDQLARRMDNHFLPVRVLDRRREDGRNARVVDSLQAAFDVAAFPTLVIFSPASGRHYTQSGFAGADTTGNWLTTIVQREEMAKVMRTMTGKP